MAQVNHSALADPSKADKADKVSLTGKGVDNMFAAETGGEEIGSADHLLESLGYTPELIRSRSTLQVAFMSFVLASIPYGLSTTFTYPVTSGGAANIIWGWVGVSLIVLCVAASLGEITSVYPTAGGVYYQTFMLSPVKWRRLSSWVCGWLYVVGNITITLAVNFGSALFLIGCINVFKDKDGNDIFEGNAWQVFLIFLAITLLCNAVSSLGNKWLTTLDTSAIYWTIFGVIALDVVILVRAKGGRHTAEYVFTDFEPISGWPKGWSFCIGLLQAAYGTSSTGMIISMCEEVQAPATQVPKAMVATIVINLFAGLAMLIPLVFVLPDLTELASSAQPVPVIVLRAVGHSGGAFALLIPLIALALLCGIGCTTAASRCTWAFARDGAIPGSKWWKVVNRKMDVPFNAMMLSMVVQIALGLIYFGSYAAYSAFSGVGVICLTASYACPIAVSLARGRHEVSAGKFRLGKLGVFCNVVALCWSLLAIPLFCMPTTIPVDPESMNYAAAVFVAFVLLSLGWYIAWGHRNYVGPPQ